MSPIFVTTGFPLLLGGEEGGGEEKLRMWLRKECRLLSSCELDLEAKLCIAETIEPLLLTSLALPCTGDKGNDARGLKFDTVLSRFSFFVAFSSILE